MRRQIPLILDTDIGGDIDDTWALAMLLKCPHLDVRLIVSSTGDTEYRAKIVGKMLEIAGRTDIPIALGPPTDQAAYPQAQWVAGYDLADYPGEVLRDGVAAMVEALKREENPTLLCIGPATTVARAMERDPSLAPKTRFVGMFGCIRRSKNGSDRVIAEYNVKADIPAAQAVFVAPWQEMRITPLDTCGQVRLDGSLYARVRDCREPLPAAVMENYRLWAPTRPEYDPATRTSVLFDCVAVHLVYSTQYLAMEHMGLRVDDEGFTVRDDSARPADTAIDWCDLDGFKADLVAGLCATRGQKITPRLGPRIGG